MSITRLFGHLFAATGIFSSLLLLTEVAQASVDIQDKAGASTSVSTSQAYYVEDIKAAMMQHIENTIDENGVFRLKDGKTGELLELKFVRIHDPVRQIGSDIYFACTDFHVIGEDDKLYDLDFWMNDKTGELRIYQSKVHKEPKWSLLYGWYKQPRYTFVNDEIEYLY